MLATQAAPREGPRASGPSWPRPSRLRRESCCSSLRNAEPQRQGRKRWEITAPGGQRPRRTLSPKVNSASGREAAPPKAQAGPQFGGDNHAAAW